MAKKRNLHFQNGKGTEGGGLTTPHPHQSTDAFTSFSHILQKPDVRRACHKAAGDTIMQLVRTVHSEAVQL
jgi:hypothetical protein